MLFFVITSSFSVNVRERVHNDVIPTMKNSFLRIGLIGLSNRIIFCRILLYAYSRIEAIVNCVNDV